MNRIVMNEEDLISLVSNGLIFKNIQFSQRNLYDLVSGEITEIDNNMVILQDIGYERISNILTNI
jgi:hypothetical protein